MFQGAQEKVQLYKTHFFQHSMKKGEQKPAFRHTEYTGIIILQPHARTRKLGNPSQDKVIRKKRKFSKQKKQEKEKIQEFVLSQWKEFLCPCLFAS